MRNPESSGTGEGSVTPRQGARPNVCVVFATRGRAEVLAKTLAAIRLQSLPPRSIIISCVGDTDVAGIDLKPDLTILRGPAGLTRQRNTALRQIPEGTDHVVFFDDDFLPCTTWIEVVSTIFARKPDVGSITGWVIADGVKGPGIAFDEAEALGADHVIADPTRVIEGYVPYGCNMAFRRSAIAGRFFDERLGHYSWLEDRDFGAALAQSGFRIIKVGAVAGVHMGVKAGRVPGRQFGYSQIVNPIYLYAKGTMSLASVSDHLFRNMASNVVRVLAPERHIDRLGRLQGNLRGIADLLRGILHPEKAASL